MKSQRINKKYISEEEEESDLIINNDELWINEKKINSEIKNNFNNNNKNILYNISVLSNSNKNNYVDIPSQNYTKSAQIINENKKKIKINNNGIDNTNEYNSANIKYINTYNDEKTIFSKIAEDLYIDNMDNKRSKKSFFDISKGKEDNYKKLTVENYLFTCADKENTKNNKKISNFIERKAKEIQFKKIGLEYEKLRKISQFDSFKRLSNVQKKIKRPKNSRSPEQFLDDQKNFEEKHKIYIDNLIKRHNEEINLRLKDRPTITKKSIHLANMNKNHNKNIYLKLYEEFDNKKKKQDEKNKNNMLLEEFNSNTNRNKKLVNEKIIENAKRLYEEYKKKTDSINENEINQLKTIKNLSTLTLINKNSNNIISKKLINNYKTELKSVFNKNLSDNFQINFNDYLLLIYKLGFTEKNYKKIIIENKKINNLILNNFQNNYNIKNKKNILLSDREKSEENKKINKKSLYLKTMSSGKKRSELDIEFKLAKDSWKIITKSKTFNRESLGSSINVLMFFLCVCGIYKGEINNSIIENEFSFILKDKENLIDINMAKNIYKHFSVFRKRAIKNIYRKFKSTKKEMQLKKIKNNNKLNQNSKSFSNHNEVINNKNLVISNNKKGCRSFKLLNTNDSNVINQISNYKTKIDNSNKNYKKYIIERVKIPSTTRYNTNNSYNFDKLNKILNGKKKIIKANNKSNQKINSIKKINKSEIKKDNKRNNSNKERILNGEKHQKEKQSSISNYIFNENIKSNSNNINNNREENKKFSEILDNYISYNKNNINTPNINNNKSFLMNNEFSGNKNNINKYNNNEEKKKNNKYIFKIKCKGDIIKFEINKNENIELKIKEICKENNLNEEEKQQIIEMINCKLKK